MKYLRIALCTLLFSLPLLSHGQVKKYFSLGVGFNQSTYYLQPGFMQDGEMGVLFERPLFIAPEFNLQFNADLNQHHSLAISANLIVYSRVIAAAFPFNLSYFYNFSTKKNSFFLKADAGYSFFLTNGALYALGAGYRYGKLRGSLTYSNQLKNNSILSENEFITGRLSSISINFEYLLRKSIRTGKSKYRRR